MWLTTLFRRCLVPLSLYVMGVYLVSGVNVLRIWLTMAWAMLKQICNCGDYVASFHTLNIFWLIMFENLVL